MSQRDIWTFIHQSEIGVISFNIAMPAYHSSAQCAGVDRVGNVALLPIKCSIRGPVPSLPKDSKDPDIVDEAIQYFKVYSH